MQITNNQSDTKKFTKKAIKKGKRLAKRGKLP